MARGAYVLADARRRAAGVILIATGSEVALCVEAYETLKREGVRARVVACRLGVVRAAGPGLSRSGAAAAPSPRGSRSRPPRRSAGTAIAGQDGAIIAMRSFGKSAPGQGRDAARIRLHRRSTSLRCARRDQITMGRARTPDDRAPSRCSKQPSLRAAAEPARPCGSISCRADPRRRRAAKLVAEDGLAGRDLQSFDLREGDRGGRRLRRS